MSAWWSGPAGPGHAGPDGSGPARAGAWIGRTMSGAADRGIGYAEAAGAAVWGGVRGAAGMARQVWIEDRPRRQWLRARRRRQWWDRGGEWRLLVALEVVGVAMWVTGRTAWRITRSTPRSTWDGAGQGWQDARTRRAGDYPGTGASGSAWTAGPRPASGRTRTGSTGPAWTAQARPEPGPDPLIQVTVDDLPRPAPAAPGPAGPVQTEIVVDAEIVNATDGPSRPSGPVPGATPHDRMFDLREAGYAGWIDQDGYAVDNDRRRLTDAEIADWIATGRRGDWPSAATFAAAAASSTPQSTPSSTPVHPPQDPGVGQPVAQLPDAGPTTQPSNTSTQEEHPMSMPTLAANAAAGTASTTLGGELTGPADLLAETSHVQGLAERAAAVQSQLQDWAAGLPELVTAAPWGTRDVASAADGIAQAQGTDGLRETITGLHGALDSADELGEALGSIGATGSVDALAAGQ